MIIKCWGARGSIPVSGKEYVKYGGDTTCMEIRNEEDDIIIIDAGTGLRRLGDSLVQKNRFKYTWLFTHSHWDHLMGLPFFEPLYIKETKINILGCPFEEESLRSMISKTMKPPHFPVDFDNIRAETIFDCICASNCAIGPLETETINLSHPNNGLGYKFTEKGKTFVFLTDNELTYIHPGGLEYNAYLQFSENADLLIHDAEYTPQEYKNTRRWGHTVYTDAVDLAIRAGVKRLGLFHHNRNRNDDQLDEMVQDCLRIAESRNSSLECFALTQDMEIILS